MFEYIYQKLKGFYAFHFKRLKIWFQILLTLSINELEFHYVNYKTHVRNKISGITFCKLCYLLFYVIPDLFKLFLNRVIWPWLWPSPRMVILKQNKHITFIYFVWPDLDTNDLECYCQDQTQWHHSMAKARLKYSSILYLCKIITTKIPVYSLKQGWTGILLCNDLESF